VGAPWPGAAAASAPSGTCNWRRAVQNSFIKNWLTYVWLNASYLEAISLSGGALEKKVGYESWAKSITCGGFGTSKWFRSNRISIESDPRYLQPGPLRTCRASALKQSPVPSSNAPLHSISLSSAPAMPNPESQHKKNLSGSSIERNGPNIFIPICLVEQNKIAQFTESEDAHES
jgi:hypothetical protein